MDPPCSGAAAFAGGRAPVPVSALYGVRGSFGATERIWRHPRNCPKLALRSRGRTKMAAPKQAREAVTPKAGLYIASIAAAGLALLTLGLSHWQSSGTARFAAFFFLAAAASTQKIRLPRMRGTMSLSFLFILIGIANFSFSETLLLGCTAALIQTFWMAKRQPRVEQVVFNIATLVLCAGFADWMGHEASVLARTNSLVLLIAAATFLFLVLNTGLVAVVISLTEQKPFRKEWLYCFYWSFPNFLVGGVTAGDPTGPSRSGVKGRGGLSPPLSCSFLLCCRSSHPNTN